MTRQQSAIQKRQNAERAIVNYLAASKMPNPRASGTYRALNEKLAVARRRENMLEERRCNQPPQPHQVAA